MVRTADYNYLNDGSPPLAQDRSQVAFWKLEGYTNGD